MNKTIAAAAIAGSLAVGGLAGATLGAPGIAGATDLAASAAVTAGAGWVQDALAGLVADSTITQEQADAVETALNEARPERGHRVRHHLPLEIVAETLGVTEDELRTALRGGQTVADVAAAEGVEVDAVVDAVLTELRTRLAERVEAGDLTQQRADEMIARATERLPSLLEGEGRFGGPGRRGR